MKKITHQKCLDYVVLALTGITLLSGAFLSFENNSVATSTTDASVTVASACTMSVSGSGGTATEDGYTYSATVMNDSTTTVTANPITTFCNDAGGFKIYAIGYSGDELGGTDMIASTSDDYNIKTDGTGAYNSYWKMKLANTTGAGITTTIPSGYTNFTTIPDDYALVAQYNSNTGNTASTMSSVTPSYQIYVASAQPAGTYTGKVKYTLVHPTSAAAPIIPPTYMQNTTAVAAKVPNIGDTATVVDARDGTSYRVGRLADGNIWMLENLALDLTNTNVKNAMYSSTNPSYDTKTNASNTTLGYLFNGGGSSPYTNYAVAAATSSNYYDMPAIAKSGTCNNAYCVNSPSSGNWSYDAVTSATINNVDSYSQGKIGVYYNYCAASAGSYCYAKDSGVDKDPNSAIDANEDICPSGWRMPTGGPIGADGTTTEGGGEYQNLYSKYGNAQAFQTALSTPLSGYFNNGKAYHQGSDGNLWSSTWYNGNDMYPLRVYSTNVYPQNHFGRHLGNSVRCLVGS